MEYPTFPGRLTHILLQSLHIRINAVHLFGDVYALRTMSHTSFAADAMVCLPQLRHTAVIPDLLPY